MKHKYFSLLIVAPLILLGNSCNKQTYPPPVTNPPVEDQTYKNQTYGFEFKYPKNFSFVTASYADLQDKIVQIQTDRNEYPKTNFGDAAFSVSASYAKSLKDCLALPQIESVNDFFATTTINGKTFYFATSTGAGAGNFYESRSYRSLVGGYTCIELKNTIHTTNIGNYDPGTVSEVNKEPIWKSLESITNSFTFTE